MRLKWMPSSSKSVETRVISFPESIMAASSPIPETVVLFGKTVFSDRRLIRPNFPKLPIGVPLIPRSGHNLHPPPPFEGGISLFIFLP